MTLGSSGMDNSFTLRDFVAWAIGKGFYIWAIQNVLTCIDTNTDRIEAPP